jgi:hypothetical protein
MYAMSENDVLSYEQQSVITESVINGFNCKYHLKGFIESLKINSIYDT